MSDYKHRYEGWKNSLPHESPEVWHQKTLETERHYRNHKIKHHAKHHTNKWLPWLLLLLALLLLASRAHAQGSSIYTIKFQDASGSTLKTYASPFAIKCGANVTCTPGAGGILTITASVTGGGGGSVTSFSSGNLSPLFTTSVATSTTTPAQTFTLSSAAAHTFFGNNTGASAAPAYFVPVAADLPNLPESQITNLTTDLGGKAASNASITVNGVTCTLSGTCTVADATKVPTTTTVNGHALSSNVSVTAADVGLGNVANVDTTNAANISSGTLPAGSLPAMTGDATAAAGSTVTTVAKVNGTSVPTNAAADQTIVTAAAATGAWTSIGSCSGASNALTYNTSTHVFGCNTITGSGGSTPTGTGFSHITSGVQDGAAAAVNLGTADTTGNLTPAKGVDPASYFDISDEFISGTVTSGAIGQLGWTFGSGTATNLTGAAANHPGVLQRATGTTSSTVTYMETLNAVSTMPLNTISNVAWKVTWIAGQDATSTNPSTQITIRLGLVCNGAASAAPSQGIYFENVTTTTAANWSGVVKGASTSTSGGATALNAGYHRFEITNDGSNNIQFFLDGTQYGSTVTTNIPTTSCMPFTQIINTEATSKILDVDYFRLWMAVTR